MNLTIQYFFTAYYSFVFLHLHVHIFLLAFFSLEIVTIVVWTMNAQCNKQKHHVISWLFGYLWWNVFILDTCDGSIDYMQYFGIGNKVLNEIIYNNY